MARGSLPSFIVSVSLTLAAGCGGTSVPAKAVSNDTGDQAEGGTASRQKGVSSDTGDKATPESSSAEQKADGSSSDDASEAPYVRTPKDILTAPDVVFMFSFAKSDVNDKADQRCEKASKGNAEKRAKCMTKERSKFKSDGYHFKQGDNGQWYWLTLRRKGKDLVWIHRIPIEFGESKEHEITLKITGRDRGQTPFAHPPSEVVFEVPNDYQIIQTDPDLGKLVFEAKIGILGQGTDDR